MISVRDRDDGNPVREAQALAGGQHAALDAAGRHRVVMQPGEAGHRRLELRLLPGLVGQTIPQDGLGSVHLRQEGVAGSDFCAHGSESRGGCGHG